MADWFWCGVPVARQFEHESIMRLAVDDEEVLSHLDRYIKLLRLPIDQLWVTTAKPEFERWLGRKVASGLGGAYVFLPRQQAHAVLINLIRIDRSRPRAVEIVVAEELLHMRDRLDGDLRRHAKHGYDRIAVRVAGLTGATLDEVRTCLLPARRRPARLIYACPSCRRMVARRRRGVWSCGACEPRFDQRYVLQLVGEIPLDLEPK